MSDPIIVTPPPRREGSFPPPNAFSVEARDGQIILSQRSPAEAWLEPRGPAEAHLWLNPDVALNESALHRLGSFFEWQAELAGASYETERPAAVRWDETERVGVVTNRGTARPRAVPVELAAPRRAPADPSPDAASTPAPAGAERLRGLSLPARGDRFAVPFAIAGVTFYVIFNLLLVGALVRHSRTSAAATVGQLVGLGAPGARNYPLLLLILLGIAVFGVAVWSAWWDARHLREEEEDVDWLYQHGREGMGLVFAPAGQREAMFRRGIREANPGQGRRVDTLMDDRVRRVLEKENDRYALVSPDELRVIAETRTSRYGSVARFASSLLLLLAVLGTFAGVKTALPGLIDAVRQTGDGGSGSTAAITGPLQAVADAFGGNVLALVGAIAAGLMAQGLLMGRRNLLERLELVSTEYLYGGLQVGTADPLTEAVRELRETAGQVRDAGYSIAGVETGMNALGEAFGDAFDRLNERLVDLAEQQERALHERTSQELRELQRRVVDLAGVVEANTRAYQGIVDTVDERGRESRETVERVLQTAGSLQQALRSVAEFQASAQRSAEGVQATLQALQEGSDVATGRMETVAASLEGVTPAITQVERLLTAVSERMTAVDQRASEAWSQAGREVSSTLAQVVKQLGAPRGGGGFGADETHALMAPGAARDPEVAALLRRVAAAVEAPRQPALHTLALVHGAGILAAAGAVAVVYGAYRLISGLVGG